MTEPRPAPKYGEYATPEDAAAAAAAAAAPAAAGEHAATSAGQRPGVPHNLGVRAQGAGQGAPAQVPAQPAPPATSAGQESQKAAPGQATAPVQAAEQSQQATGTPASAAPTSAPVQPAPTPSGPVYTAQPSSPNSAAASAEARKRKLKADSIVTIVLLVLGALGVIQYVQGLHMYPEVLSIAADAAKLTDYTPSEGLQTIISLGTLGMVAIHAIVLVWSIRRMVIKKFAFWLPLVGGFVAFVLMIALSATMWSMEPDLLQAMADPSFLQRFIDNLTELQ